MYVYIYISYEINNKYKPKKSYFCRYSTVPAKSYQP